MQGKALALTPLVTAAGAVTTIFLALDHSWVPREVATFGEHTVGVWVEREQSSAETHAHCASLASVATTVSVYRDIDLLAHLEGDHRGDAGGLVDVTSKVLAEWATIDGEFTSAWTDADTSNSVFTAAGSPMELAILKVHQTTEWVDLRLFFRGFALVGTICSDGCRATEVEVFADFRLSGSLFSHLLIYEALIRALGKGRRLLGGMRMFRTTVDVEFA